MIKTFLKNLAIFAGKLQACNFVKKNSIAGIFHWILPNFYGHLLWRTSANYGFWCFKTAAEHRWAAASVLTLLLSLNNLLTGHEKLSY